MLLIQALARCCCRTTILLLSSVKKLGPRRRVTSTYHKELYAIVEAVQKWRQYLLGREFVIRTDQKSLRELLQQVIQTPDQQLYARKLMGFKLRIEYKTGASNRVADALSRRDDDSSAALADLALLVAVSQPVPDILEVLRVDVRTIPALIDICTQIEAGSAPPGISLHDGLLYRGRQIMVSADSAAKPALLYEHHSTPAAGHPGVERTFRRLATSFYWPGMRRDVKDFVAACFECQTTKYSTQKPAGLSSLVYRNLAVLRRSWWWLTDCQNMHTSRLCLHDLMHGVWLTLLLMWSLNTMVFQRRWCRIVTLFSSMKYGIIYCV